MKIVTNDKATRTEEKQCEQVSRALLKTIRDLEKLMRDHPRLMLGTYGKKTGGKS